MPKVEDIFKPLQGKPVLVAAHRDADGIASLTLFRAVAKKLGIDYSKRLFPGEFGDYTVSDDLKAAGFEKVHIMLDMRPDNNFDGVVIDHHPGHKDAVEHILIDEALDIRYYPPKGTRKYHLIWGRTPTARIMYELFKGYIPREIAWKAVVGICGDGQPEAIPPEFWEWYPELREDVVTPKTAASGYEYYSDFPIYLKLSSSINAVAKAITLDKARKDVRYGPGAAYDMLKATRWPYEILSKDAPASARVQLSKERSVIRRTYPIIRVGPMLYWPIRTAFSLHGELASRVYGKTNRTCLVLNQANNHLSLRGAMAPYVQKRLAAMGYHVDGHLGYCGGKLAEGQTWETLYNALRAIFYPGQVKTIA